MSNPVEIMLELIDQGGNVLWLIFIVATLLWALCVERILYLWIFSKQDQQTALAQWRNRYDQQSWCAQHIKSALLNQIKNDVLQNQRMIATLVALCPLLGLLGTVTGMIEVFDSMSAFSSSDAKAMAAGVSKATIPTMAGMVVALFGLILKTVINRKTENLVLDFNQRFNQVV